jgi:hypothetical protein
MLERGAVRILFGQPGVHKNNKFPENGRMKLLSGNLSVGVAGALIKIRQAIAESIVR